MLGRVIREFLPAPELLNYFDAILRVYNLHGRRDNKYKARIKILVKELTPAEFTRQVEAEWERLRGGPGTVPEAEIARLATHFTESAVPRIRPRQRRLSCRRRRQPAALALGAAQRACAQAQGLRDRHAIAQAHRNSAR